MFTETNIFFPSEVFVFPRICRQDETKHNKPQRQYFVCFSLLPPAGTFTEYPILHFSQQCFQFLSGKPPQIFWI